MLGARMRPTDNEILAIIADEGWLEEPPTYGRAPIRGPVAIVWWSLRIYLLVMVALVLYGFFH